MKRFICLFSLLVCLAGGANAGVRDEKPNFIGGEILGRGFFLTLNYERWLTNNFSLGVGTFVIGADDDVVFILPVYAGVVTGDKHGLYLSGGITTAGGGEISDFDSVNLATFGIGYQFTSDGGFFVRPLFTFFTEFDDKDGENNFLIWPGITIGGSF